MIGSYEDSISTIARRIIGNKSYPLFRKIESITLLVMAEIARSVAFGR
jgi:hypothetical protein